MSDALNIRPHTVYVTVLTEHYCGFGLNVIVNECSTFTFKLIAHIMTVVNEIDRD